MPEKPKPKTEEIEEFPDAWERFEKAFDRVMEAPRKPPPATSSREPSPKHGEKRGGKEPA